MSEFDPFAGPGAPRIEHAIVDEETQMMRYLADIAMADLELLPPESARKVRPDSLLASYRADVAARHKIEESGGVALDPAPGIVDGLVVVAGSDDKIMAVVGSGKMYGGPQVAEFKKPGE